MKKIRNFIIKKEGKNQVNPSELSKLGLISKT
jgi:hypothetical protein